MDDNKTQYTCPMHPEVKEDKPGVCPKCGMQLEAIDENVKEEGPGEIVSASHGTS